MCVQKHLVSIALFFQAACFVTGDFVPVSVDYPRTDAGIIDDASVYFKPTTNWQINLESQDTFLVEASTVD